MPSFNQANFDEAMKEMYPYKKVENLVYDNNPLLAMLPKETKFPGRNATYAVEYGVTPGRSANFQTAQNNRGGTKIQDFVVKRIKDYAVVSLDNETLLAADGKEGSLLDVAKVKTDSALLALSRSMGRDVFRSGDGAIGVNDVSEATTPGEGAVVTLTVADDVVNFETGMRVCSALATDPGGSLYANGAAVEIIRIDRDAGTLTLASDMEDVWGSGTAIAADSVLIPEGDAQDGGDALKMTGLDAWIPAVIDPTSSGSDVLWGCNRAQDSTRLGGQRVAAGADTKVRAIIRAGTRLAREGGRPDAVFVNPMDHEQIAAELEGHGAISTIVPAAASQRRYSGKDSAVQFGFTSISVATPAGTVDIISDHNCPSGTAYMLQMSTWALKSIGAAPRVLDFDGLKGLREANSDGVEYRWGYYGNLLCKAPAYNCRITF